MANGQIPLNPLSALFRGFQTGQAAVQKREQDAIENELTQQLRQIQLINAQRALTEASKTPQQRLAEQIQEAFTVDALKRGALVQAPAGLEGESIALPSAIDQTAAQLEAAQTFSPVLQATPLDITTGQPAQPSLSDALSQIVVPQAPRQAPSFNIPTAASKGFEEPSPIPGFNISEEAARQKTAQDITKLMQQEQIKAQFSRGNKKALGLTPDSKGVVVQDQSTGDITVEAIPGGGIASLPTSRGGAGATRQVTPNQIAAAYEKAGTAGLTREQVDRKYLKDGVLDVNTLLLDSSRLISQDKKLAAEEKAKQIPAADRSKAVGFIAAYDDLNKLTDMVTELKAEGGEPGVWARAVGTALENPPDGVFSALYQSAIGQSLTADDRQLNALKARVRSAVTKANAGLSQTQREIANVSQYVPTTNDTLEQTLAKASGLQEYLKSQVSAITTDPRDWLQQLDQAPMVDAPSPSIRSPAAPITIKSIRKKQ